MIQDQKDLQALLKLCRKQGVAEITLEGISIKFGDLPTKKERQAQESDDDDTDQDPDIDPLTGLTQEQLMFLSVTPQGAQS